MENRTLDRLPQTIWVLIVFVEQTHDSNFQQKICTIQSLQSDNFIEIFRDNSTKSIDICTNGIPVKLFHVYNIQISGFLADSLFEALYERHSIELKRLSKPTASIPPNKLQNNRIKRRSFDAIPESPYTLINNSPRYHTE